MADILFGCDDRESQGIFLQPPQTVQHLFVPSDNVTQPLFLVIHTSFDACFVLSLLTDAVLVVLLNADISANLDVDVDASFSLDLDRECNR